MSTNALFTRSFIGNYKNKQINSENNFIQEETLQSIEIDIKNLESKEIDFKSQELYNENIDEEIEVGKTEHNFEKLVQLNIHDKLQANYEEEELSQVD